MKRVLLIIALFVLIQNWQWLWTYVSGGIDYDPVAQGEVVLLSTASCPYCRKMRRYLAASAVPYTELDVERSAEGARRFRAVGALGVPVVLVGDQVVYGYDLGALRDAFAAAAPIAR